MEATPRLYDAAAVTHDALRQLLAQQCRWQDQRHMYISKQKPIRKSGRQHYSVFHFCTERSLISAIALHSLSLSIHYRS